ncbi:MAG: SUMF1/EgtB/PvdO family nonheme iron enzyme [Methylococcales bacterium]|nr:SUMF1/EgtB/PvdO family nonheme iron enzyme [Methylococcales bacterium]
MNIKNVLAIMALSLCLQTVQARVALLIGNDNYSDKIFPELDQAVNDTDRLANKLKVLGFSVIQKKNLSYEKMREAIREFNQALRKNNEVGLFYYAGHGMQIEGENYLIPIKAHISREFEVKTEAVNTELVLNAMYDAKTKINLVILDACRDNIFSSRGASRGLANIARKNTFIAYATQPNESAEDGTFMDFLASRITEKLSIDQMFKKVINDVREQTGGMQVPSFTYNLLTDFYFNLPDKKVTASVPTQMHLLRIKPTPKKKRHALLPSTPIVSQLVAPLPLESCLMIEPEMVNIKGGCYQMGSTTSEKNRSSDEKQKTVCIDNFEMGKFEVTQQQWLDIMGDRPSNFRNNQYPVESVSWKDVQKFIEKLNAKTNNSYRLPTEEEWEYAARSGNNGVYHWGNTIDCSKANYNGCDIERTTEVGSYPPNRFGLYDMSGNVWEWMCSKYDRSYDGNKNQCLSKTNSNFGYFTIRGGSWASGKGRLRSANRSKGGLKTREYNLGFRLARTH